MADETINDNYNTYPWRDGDWTNITQEANKYGFLEDSLLGTGGYRNGWYLVPHKREDKNDLNMRKSKAYYSNQYRPIWSAHHKPIFKNKAIRTISESTPQGFIDLYEVFKDNCDGKGNSLQSFMEQGAGATKNKGAVFLVMNNDTEINATIEDVISSRSGVPYVFEITPEMVHSYKQDSFGNLTELRWWQQKETLTYDQFGNPSNLLLSDSITSTEKIVVGVNDSEWSVYDGNGSTLLQSFPNEIGVIPVVRLVAEPSDEVIPESSLYSVARIQHRIYNLASIITDIADNQAFSILTMPMTANSGVDYGTTKGLGYPSDASRSPEFISPDAQQLKVLIELYHGLINEMYQAGVVSHLQRFQQSAESKEIDRERLNDLLGTFKSQIEQAERRLMFLFGLYVGYDYEYRVTYSDDFGVSTLNEQVDMFIKLMSAGVTTGLSAELEKQIAEKALDFEDEEMRNELLERIEQERDTARTQSAIENQY